MSYTKTDWTNGSGEKINSTNLNHIETGIYNNDTSIGDISSLETTATDLVGAINEVNSKSIVYSSEEFETGEIWIDGESKVYGKVFTLDIGTATSYNIAHDITISNISKIWVDIGNSFFVTPYVSQNMGHYSSNDDYSRIYLTGENIYCTFGSVYSTISKTAYITIKYVKSS